MSKTKIYVKYYKRKRSKKRGIVGMLLIIFFAALIFFMISNHNNRPKNTVPKIVAPIITKESNSQVLGEAIDNALVGAHGKYGIVVYKFDPEEVYTENEKELFDSASLYKLWVMATAFEQIKDGKIKENTILSQDVSVLVKEYGVASDAAGLNNGRITMTVSQALEKMITVSDNTSALVLSDKIGLGNVSNFLLQNGFIGSHLGNGMDNPKVSPYDVALFFDKLHDGAIVDKNYSDKMLSLLKRQRLNEKVPKYLPVGMPIAHKTGELDNFSHDAGIVFSPAGDYIIVVLSSSEDRDLANERIANISNNVYNYFNKASSSASL